MKVYNLGGTMMVVTETDEKKVVTFSDGILPMFTLAGR